MCALFLAGLHFCLQSSLETTTCLIFSHIFYSYRLLQFLYPDKMNGRKKNILNMLMTIELSSLKIRKTSCCKPEKLNNRMIALYVSGTLKHSMHMTIIKYSKHLMFDHVLSWTTINITVCFLCIRNKHSKSWTRLFRWSVCWS